MADERMGNVRKIIDEAENEPVEDINTDPFVDLPFRYKLALMISNNLVWYSLCMISIGMAICELIFSAGW